MGLKKTKTKFYSVLSRVKSKKTKTKDRWHFGSNAKER